MKSALLQRLLAALSLAACLGYFLALALRPDWLSGCVAGLPLSILLALAVILLLCLVSTLYSRVGDGEDA
ncbi:DUF485 domain-containing protein [Chromobacterium violaceum]|uniref:Protein of uncharacterized function, DUF485 n=1 Tax=Chromobacterium violaceum TaxID=536 RepID=A0AAX2M5M1_CHRVL|nr:DUF485 domain-containing protein [Chromobacterium violaceum]OLZ80113.1 hypothetical protein BS642_10375 [Chromobacterium violaceum]STB69050.1 Protein of uncharacterised function, DUF485 [Chromobacterium violaceum]SUX31116.1 Protein of uncharacterised function, DUF485 [Chromobacterium violaceum]